MPQRLFVFFLCRESPSGCESQQPRRKKFEIEAAVKSEAHKLKRITEAQASLAALKDTGENDRGSGGSRGTQAKFKSHMARTGFELS